MSCYFVLTENILYLAVHGHKYGVKRSLETLKAAARKKGADILLYGHTHERFCSYEDGLYIMNPGSTSCPRDCGKAHSVS